MGTQPLVSGIWEKSCCLWPKSNSLQDRAPVSTSKGENGEGEPLISPGRRHVELPALIYGSPLLETGFLQNIRGTGILGLCPERVQGHWVIREEREAS